MSERKKFRIQRALGIELPGLGKPGALEKRNYPPGQHGPDSKRKAATQHGVQLREKQKLLFHYGLREQQLRHFVRKARSMNSSNWIESLVGLLERRLDNVVFRLGFARSMAAARQLVSHGHIMVNGRLQTIGSMVLRVGSRISLTAYAQGMTVIQDSLANPRLSIPSYLQFEDSVVKGCGLVLALPGIGNIPFEFNAAQVAEYYAKRGV